MVGVGAVAHSNSHPSTFPLVTCPPSHQSTIHTTTSQPFRLIKNIWKLSQFPSIEVWASTLKSCFNGLNPCFPNIYIIYILFGVNIYCKRELKRPIYWVNPSKRGGMDKVFRGLLQVISRLFYSDLHAISNRFFHLSKIFTWCGAETISCDGKYSHFWC